MKFEIIEETCLDFIDENCLTIFEWLVRKGHTELRHQERFLALIEFLCKNDSVKINSDLNNIWVTFDWKNDCAVFILKYYNNGSTLIIKETR